MSSLLNNITDFSRSRFSIEPNKSGYFIVAQNGSSIRRVALCETSPTARGLLQGLRGSSATYSGAPTLIQMSPQTIPANAWEIGWQQVVVEGTEFRDGASVSVAGIGLSFLNRATTGFANDILWGNWTSGNLSVGVHDATYSDPDGNVVVLSNALTVTDPIAIGLDMQDYYGDADTPSSDPDDVTRPAFYHGRVNNTLYLWDTGVLAWFGVVTV